MVRSRFPATTGAFASEEREMDVMTLFAVEAPASDGAGESVEGNSVTADKTTGELGDVVVYTIDSTPDYTPLLYINGNTTPVLLEKSADTWTYSYTITSLQHFQSKGVKNIQTVFNSFGEDMSKMPRIVYVYEGVDTEEDGRAKLMNTKYFGGVYEGTDGIKQLWDEVYEYIEKAYDTDSLKQIYINGDGAPWIKAGVKYIAQSKFVLDKYHMHKYIMAATAHLEDSADDARSEIYRAIHKKAKWMAEGTFDKILSITEKESKQKAVQTAKNYILSNWSGIMLSMKSKDENIECSAEGVIRNITYFQLDENSSN